jgi:deazaflavin-dependent oxidoreductase (nitroreductase family)
MLLLHTTGAQSGQERINPLVHQPLPSGDVAIFASKGGAPTNPDWYHNLVAHPDASIEVATDRGIEQRDVSARVAEGAERAEIWERQKQLRPNFADYERSTARVIPVLVLTKR